MDSDDSNIPDHVGDLDIQPYQFEPFFFFFFRFPSSLGALLFSHHQYYKPNI
jgi:hypothetical protein